MSQPLFAIATRFSSRGAVRLRSHADIAEAYAQTKRGLWLLGSDERELRLLTANLRAAVPRHRLLSFGGLSPSRKALLDALFGVVLAPDAEVRLLTDDELLEVVASREAADLFIGVRYVPEDRRLVLYRGNLDALVAPVSMFRARRSGPKPDPANAEIIDFGQTLRLGDYEASTNSILYELDEAARGRMKKRALASDESLGASIRRLRLQKGLKQSDFSVISARTIARIERNETVPHAKTLAALANSLNVLPSELGRF